MTSDSQRYDAARDLLHLHLDPVRRLLQTLLLDILPLNLLLQLLVPLLLRHHGRTVLLLLAPNRQSSPLDRLKCAAATIGHLDIILDGTYLLRKRVLHIKMDSVNHLFVLEQTQSIQHFVGEHDEVDRRTKLLPEASGGRLKQI